MGMHGKEFPDFLAGRAHFSIGRRTNSNSPISAANIFGAFENRDSQYPKDLNETESVECNVDHDV